MENVFNKRTNCILHHISKYNVSWHEVQSICTCLPMPEESKSVPVILPEFLMTPCKSHFTGTAPFPHASRCIWDWISVGGGVAARRKAEERRRGHGSGATGLTRQEDLPTAPLQSTKPSHYWSLLLWDMIMASVDQQSSLLPDLHQPA